MRDVLSVFRKAVVSVSLLGAVTVLAPLAQAQQNSAVRGGLAGVVTDSVGAVVPNAKVVISGPQGKVESKSDANGKYEVTGLTPGLYTLTVSAPGFATYSSKNNEVTIDHTQTLNAKLSVGEVGTTITVEGGVTAIDTESTSVNTAITDTFYNALPLPRNVAGTFYIAPGVVSGGGTGTANPSIGGASGLENLYVADGVTITDQAFGGLGVYVPSYGSLGTGINLEFVKEVDIKTAAFEPKYGQADGGIIEIVTKSGSNQYHGAVNMYVTPQKTQATPKFFEQVVGPAGSTVGFANSNPSNLLAQPAYEASAQFGGYLPGMREKLFFFGAFDPTLTRSVSIAYNRPAATLYNNGPYTFSTTALNWAGKLTYQPFASTIVEASSYGDPSKRNSAPATLSTTSAPSVTSSYKFGTRNSIMRINTQATKAINVFGAFAYNHANFNETPSFNTYQVSDRTIPSLPSLGFGTYYRTNENTWQLQGEATANSHFFGKHVTSIGYLYSHTNFTNSTLRSGPGYAIPTSNAAGASIAALYPAAAKAIGQISNATFRLFRADGAPAGSAATGNVGCTFCALYNGNQVYLQVYRGTYVGSVVNTIDRYHAAYGNEVWTPERHITINAGLRWEQQAYGGSLLVYHWRDNWSPRVGATIDPFGNRKSKIFFAWSRYSVPIPLDAAIRQLGNEQDDTSFFFAPQKDSSGNAVLNSFGEVIPDTSAALNGTQRSAALGNFGAPSFASSTGEGIVPGTKMEMQDEFLLGVEREVKPGLVASVRYTDRQYKRIVEDIGSQSPEGSLVDGDYAGGIANVTGSTDLFINENEVTYTPAQFLAANGGKSPAQTSAATYVAPVAGCTYKNDTTVANGGYFQRFDSTPYNGSCITNSAVAGGFGSDGKPDGFADPRRHYQALELELNRALRNHWQARINYRYAKVFGNYEGFFRNDNGQSDPGISSLFDFTQGSLGLLGDQFKRGYLNSDRRHVANVLIAYTLDKSMPYVSRLSGLTIGSYFHALSGTPLSGYQSHPIYGNTGEVPVGGRGTVGRTPVALQLDLSADYGWHIHDKYVIRGTFDGFNVTNTRPATNLSQNLDIAVGTNNPDKYKATSFQRPFVARFKLGFEF